VIVGQNSCDTKQLVLPNADGFPIRKPVELLAKVVVWLPVRLSQETQRAINFVLTSTRQARGLRVPDRGSPRSIKSLPVTVMRTWQPEQGQDTPPAWPKNPQRPTHQPAAPEPWSEGRPACNRLWGQSSNNCTCVLHRELIAQVAGAPRLMRVTPASHLNVDSLKRSPTFLYSSFPLLYFHFQNFKGKRPKPYQRAFFSRILGKSS